jgi:hypothetical protein
MFRAMSGYKAQYHDLTLVAVSAFNEWKVLVYGPGVTVHGSPQFSEAKAKEHAIAAANGYLHDRKHEEMPADATVEWTPTAADDWLNWC